MTCPPHGRRGIQPKKSCPAGQLFSMCGGLLAVARLHVGNATVLGVTRVGVAAFLGGLVFGVARVGARIAARFADLALLGGHGLALFVLGLGVGHAHVLRVAGQVVALFLRHAIRSVGLFLGHLGACLRRVVLAGLELRTRDVAVALGLGHADVLGVAAQLVAARGFGLVVRIEAVARCLDLGVAGREQAAARQRTSSDHAQLSQVHVDLLARTRL